MVYENYRSARDVARAKLATAKEQLDTAVNLAKQNNQAIAERAGWSRCGQGTSPGRPKGIE
jgi:hypothetical protein